MVTAVNDDSTLKEGKKMSVKKFVSILLPKELNQVVYVKRKTEKQYSSRI